MILLPILLFLCMLRVALIFFFLLCHFLCDGSSIFRLLTLCSKWMIMDRYDYIDDTYCMGENMMKVIILIAVVLLLLVWLLLLLKLILPTYSPSIRPFIQWIDTIFFLIHPFSFIISFGSVLSNRLYSLLVISTLVISHRIKWN